MKPIIATPYPRLAGNVAAAARGTAGLRGWRAKIGDAVAGPAARHSRLSVEQARAVVGGLFFLLSLVYVTGTVRRIVARRPG